MKWRWWELIGGEGSSDGNSRFGVVAVLVGGGGDFHVV
jgi:hypothetical protein